MFDKEFWDNRAKLYGHTGHGEPFHYCFDQQARLYAIHTILNRLKIPKKRALDFGCGNGDFVKLLSGQFEAVIGFDISEEVIKLAKGRFHNSNVQLSTNFIDLIIDTQYDLILSVTVLQTLALEDLEKTISHFSDLLQDKGVLICMEFFSTDEYNAEANENRITQVDWIKVVLKNHFKVLTIEGFYNPILFPSKSWQVYSKSVFTKFLKLFKNKVFAKNRLEKIAREIIYKNKDVFPYPTSSFKVYVLEKTKET